MHDTAYDGITHECISLVRHQNVFLTGEEVRLMDVLEQCTEDDTGDIDLLYRYKAQGWSGVYEGYNLYIPSGFFREYSLFLRIAILFTF